MSLLHLMDKITPIRNHPRIVQHIKEMPLIWRANTEAQVITSHHQLLMYIVKYVMKAEKSSDVFNRISKELLQKEGQHLQARKMFIKLLMNTINRDKSHAECFLIVQEGNFVEYSQSYVPVNLNGSKRLKDNISSENDGALEAIDWLTKYEQRDENVNYKKLCNDYAQRHENENYRKLCENYPKIFKFNCHPKNISLRNMVTYFTKDWKIKNKTTFPVFTPVPKFPVKKISKSYESMCRCILLSEKPGCYSTNVGTEFQSFEEELRDFVLNSEFCPPYIKKEFEDSQLECPEDLNPNVSQNEQLLISPLQNPGDEDRVPTPLQIHLLPEENQEAMEIDDEVTSDYDPDEFNNHLSYNWSSDKDILCELIGETELQLANDWLKKEKQEYVSKEPETEEEVDFNKCNADQKYFYQFICDWIQKKIDNADHESIYSILSGRAGCGKTFVVKCIQKFIKDKQCKEGFLKLAAPTGTAAFLIKGTTLHSLFALPVNIPFQNELPPLKGSRLQHLQMTFANTEILIIDEMSMVGQYMLYQINKRLQEAKPNKSTQYFAGVSIVLMGDFTQLPPVTDLPLFATVVEGEKTFTNADKEKKKRKRKISQYQCKGRKLYIELFDKCFTLNESMRQKGEAQAIFRDILNKVANGTFNHETWYMLKDNAFKMNSDKAIDEFKKDAVMLCAYNKNARLYNIHKMKALKSPIALISAVNTPPTAKKFSESKAGGLHNKTILSKDAKVMLISNLWSEQGLTNGANGYVRYIVYDQNLSPPNLPNFVLVYFPLYTGPSFFTDTTGEKLVPISPITRSWFDYKVHHERTMIPLIPSYAITIHKSQGQTLDKIILNLGNMEYASGLTYTALSRAKELENIAFEPFPTLERITNIFNKDRFKIRLNEEDRLKNEEKKHKEKRSIAKD